MKSATLQTDTLALDMPMTQEARPLALMRRLRGALRGAPVIPLIVLTVAIACALFAPILASYDPITANPSQALQAPSSPFRKYVISSGRLLGQCLLG